MTTITQPAASTAQSTEPESAVAICARGVSHAYGQRQALTDLSLEIRRGELFAILGPNGGGKTTLFRLLSTLIPLQTGSASILGYDLAGQAAAVRRLIGVVFQAPSLDRKLTVSENIRLQATLYGLSGRELTRRLDELLTHFALRDRASDLTERLSGGLRRRVELAKGLIHKPRLLLLDEPSTGLDPAVRSDLWQYLRHLQGAEGITIVLTTHYLEEAEGADRLAILHQGRLVALGSANELKSGVRGDSIVIETPDSIELAEEIRKRFSLAGSSIDGAVRLEVPEGHHWISRLVESFPGRISAIRLGKPSLEDVFIARTGHRFWRERQEAVV